MDDSVEASSISAPLDKSRSAQFLAGKIVIKKLEFLQQRQNQDEAFKFPRETAELQ